MAPECQAKSLPSTIDALEAPKVRRVFGRDVLIRTKDPKFIEEVLRRRSNGEGIEALAKDLGCHRNTIIKVIQKHGDPMGKVESILRDGMPKIADMVIVEALRKKDVRAGVAILQGAGQLDLLKPKPAADDGGRIVIEWSGAPPPWAPAPVLKAYAERALIQPPQVNPVAPVQVVEAVDAEVVDAKPAI